MGMEIYPVKNFKIPRATVGRLGVYSRFLANMERKGVLTVSSRQMAKATKLSSNQVRKDLAYFGDFGIRGVGYDVKELKSSILQILGLDKTWRLVIVGAGKLGCALATYQGFSDRGFVPVGVFDNDVSKIGAKVGHLTVYPMDRLPEVVKRFGVRIGIIAIPAGPAQEAADLLAASGIRAILNFAPVSLDVPAHIALSNVDLGFHLEAITFDFMLEIANIVRT